MSAQKYILWFKDINKHDLSSVGGKGANLGEMVSFNIPVPPGFVVTTDAYFYFLQHNKLRPKIEEFLEKIDKDRPETFARASDGIAKLILKSKMPQDLAVEIMKAYLDLGFPSQSLVAVRSSATAEDLPGASFAGQQATYLNIKGEANVVKKVQECWSSLFTARAIFYRDQQKVNHMRTGIAVPVQKMIQSESSGVMFTIDPMTNEKNKVVIEAIFGLGELIVQGSVTPDHYVVNKTDFQIESKNVAQQPFQLTKTDGKTFERKIPKSQQNRQKITNKQIIELAKLGKKIHGHYFFPQDIEWAVEKNKVYILQTRPVTTVSHNGERAASDKASEEMRKEKREVLLSGSPASPGIATGQVRIIHSPSEISKIKNGEILVTTRTTPDFVPAMKKAAAIVTDQGGQTSHAAIVSRELGIPCVVGTEKATSLLKTGQYITVNSQIGEVYNATPYDMNSSKMESLAPKAPDLLINNPVPIKTATKVYVNLAEPELAETVAKKNVDGVGLLRAEFMMAEIGVHPRKLIHDRKQKVFINKLADNLNTFCEHFSPRPVVYRASDFKTNEYRNLVGGKEFEPEEENPLLGYRGAFRYISDPEVFELELDAIKKVRQKQKNLHLMIPFVHTPWELLEVKKIIAASGLARSSTFHLQLMVEIPSNVILLEDFIKVGIDGVSIGSNDLTMLILGVDRDNSEISRVFNEQDPAVLWALEKVVKTCIKYHVTCSICGQAASTYPELVEKLVDWGITSVSINPDAVDSTRTIVAEAERKLISKRKNG